MYDDDVLDAFIGIAVREDKLDIRSFKMLLREYNNGTMNLNEQQKNSTSCSKDPPEEHALTRDCSYYEEFAKEAFGSYNQAPHADTMVQPLLPGSTTCEPCQQLPYYSSTVRRHYCL